MKIPQANLILRVAISTALMALSSMFWMQMPASAGLTETGQSSVGVLVEPTPVPPTNPPLVGEAPVSGASGGLVETGSGSVNPSKTPSSLVEELSDVRESPSAHGFSGVAANVKEGVKAAYNAAKAILKGITGGKPVADVLEDVLPKQVSDVVVPAVRTASTFVMPIGLAGAVLAFLALQNRVDSSDPKLSAAPFAHDDDVVEFI